MAIKFDELLEALDPSLDKFEEDLNSIWIIIPTERRYDDLTANDYFKFARKYGTFNNQKDCFDKIEELAPDRWDAFIPMRIEGDNSLKEDYLNSYIDELAEPLSKYMQMSSKHFNAVCDYIDDELRKPGRGLSELSKRDLEILYSVFIESDRFDESLNEAKYWNNKQNTEFYNDIRYKVDGAVYQIMKDIFKDLKIDKLAAQVHNLVPEYDPSWATHKRDDDNNLRLHKVRTGLSASLLDELSDKMNPGSLDRTVNNLRKY